MKNGTRKKGRKKWETGKKGLIERQVQSEEGLGGGSRRVAGKNDGNNVTYVVVVKLSQ